MVVRITIDHREGALKELGIENVEWKLLPLGDIIIEEDDKPLLVIERKTLKDLAASIKDGRYKSQKVRLLSAFPKDIICYIIEGYLQYNEQETNISGISVEALHSSIINTILRDKLHVFHTKDTQDTCDLIQQIFKRYCKDPEKYCNTAIAPHNEQLVTKEKVTTKKECYLAQLCQVPGISMKTAQSISDRHQNMRDLLQSIQDSSESAFEGIKTDCNGKKRTISKAVIKNLIDYLN